MFSDKWNKYIKSKLLFTTSVFLSEAKSFDREKNKLSQKNLFCSSTAACDYRHGRVSFSGERHCPLLGGGGKTIVNDFRAKTLLTYTFKTNRILKGTFFFHGHITLTLWLQRVTGAAIKLPKSLLFKLNNLLTFYVFLKADVVAVWPAGGAVLWWEIPLCLGWKQRKPYKE